MRRERVGREAGEGEGYYLFGLIFLLRHFLVIIFFLRSRGARTSREEWESAILSLPRSCQWQTISPLNQLLKDTINHQLGREKVTKGPLECNKKIN